MRKAPVGSIQRALQEAYRACGGVEVVADDLGLAVSTVSYGTEVNEARPGGLGLNYVDRLARMNPGAAEAMARHFAQLAGGCYRAPDSEGQASLLQMAGRANTEGGEAMAAAITAAESGHPEALAALVKEAREAVDAHQQVLQLANQALVKAQGQ